MYEDMEKRINEIFEDRDQLKEPAAKELVR